MSSLSLQQMDESCKGQCKKLQHTVAEIDEVLLLEGSENSKKSNDDLRELSGTIKVFLAGKLKQLNDLIEELRKIEKGEKSQITPPLFINDVQGYYDLTMIEARNIDDKIKNVLPSNAISKGPTLKF